MKLLEISDYHLTVSLVSEVYPLRVIGHCPTEGAHKQWTQVFRHAGRCLLTLIVAILLALVSPLPPKRNSSEVPDFSRLQLLAATTDGALPPRSASLELTGRVLLRLEQAERAEINPHFRDDIRIACITILYAARKEPSPFVRATYAVFGIHPDFVFAAITARRQAKLGAEYSQWYDAAGNLRADGLNKKPPASVQTAKREVA